MTWDKNFINQDLVDTVKALMIEVAADELLTRWRNLTGDEVTHKKDKSLVTVADKASEKRIIEGLSAIPLPTKAHILGEESFEADPTLADNVFKEGYCWIIDPLDGTRSFAEGKDDFGILVALTYNGETIGGWVYQPVTGIFYTALKGEGVRDKDGQLVSAPKIPEFSSDTPGFSHVQFYGRHLNFDAIQAIAHHFPEASYKRYMSAIEYINIVEGRSFFMINSLNNPWDHAAGQLLVNELGGVGKMARSGADYSTRVWKPEDHDILITALSPALYERLKFFFELYPPRKPEQPLRPSFYPHMRPKQS